MGKPVPRVLVLLFLLSVLTMVFITKWGLVMDNISTTVPQQTRHTRELFQAAIEESEKRHQTRIEELQKKIEELQELLNSQRVQRENLTNSSESKGSEIQKYLNDKVHVSEILHGVEMKNEYELTAFNRFTLYKVYPVNPGLGKRVVEKPIGARRRDLNDVITYSVNILNEQRKNASKYFTVSDFIEGIYRTEPSSGTHYELYFRNLNTKESGRLQGGHPQTFRSTYTCHQHDS